MGGSAKGAASTPNAGQENNAEQKETTREKNAGEKIYDLLHAIHTATEANGRELRAIRLLLEKTIQQGQGQQATQATARCRQEPDHYQQRRGEEAYADENNEGNYDRAAQANTPTPYDAYRAERKTQPPGVITFVCPGQEQSRSGSYAPGNKGR